MKAWLIDDQNGIDGIRLGDAPDPSPKPGQVVIQLEFAALNPADYYLAAGQYPARPAMPHVLGRDGIGTVAAVGDGVGDIKVGDQRLLLRGEAGVTEPGTLAELVAVPADRTVKPPVGWSKEQAAAAPLVYMTAHQAIKQWGDLPAKATVLVTGATGGVGVACIQLAKAWGHTVVGLSRSAEKRDELLKLGADHALDAEVDGLAKRIGDAAGKIDLCVDNVGGPGFSEVVTAMGERGRISVVGMLAGPVPSFNTAKLLFRRIRVGGVVVGSYDPSEAAAAWEEIVAAGVDPQVDSVHPFADVPRAFARLKAGPMGKVVVRVAE